MAQIVEAVGLARAGDVPTATLGHTAGRTASGQSHVDDTALQVVDDQLGRLHCGGNGSQVLKRVAQLIVQVVGVSTVLASPSTVQLLGRVEEPGHAVIVAVA